MKVSVVPAVMLVAIGLESSWAAPPAPADHVPQRAVEFSTAQCPRVQYTREAMRAGVEGKTKLAFVVDAAGSVSEVRVIHASGETAAHASLDAEAARVLAACRFPPSPGFGPVTATQTFTFKLEAVP